MASLHMKTNYLQSFFVISFLAIVSLLTSSLFIEVSRTSAQVDGWEAGRIIDDAVFTNAGTMNPTQIQQFLNNKVPVCDTWHSAGYGQNPPFICLKDYSENGRSAAQIIFDTAQQYQINPQVLLVLLQKEQGLVTDTWPLNVQYRSATGYGCPDTAPCDSQYYGLTNQLNWSGKMFRSIMNASSGWYTPYNLGSNYIRYSPDSSCGGGTVNIQNRATQALYNYTPYQPNAATLAADWGTAPCGAYGNRNFYLYFRSWFGNTLGPERSALLQSLQVYTNAEMTNLAPLSNDTVIAQPGQELFVRMQVMNNGRSTWNNDTNLGTTGDRRSAFYSDSWLGTSRVAKVTAGSDVEVNGSSTIMFKLKAPSEQLLYYESFDLVQEGVAWFNKWTTLKVQVSQPVSSSQPASTYSLTGDQYIDSSRSLITPDGYSYLRVNGEGAAELYVNFNKVWSTPAAGAGARLVMQQDGNLVLYNSSGTAIWASSTNGNSNSGVFLQTDGNLVIYTSGGQYLWQSNTSTHIPHGLYSTCDFYSGNMLFEGQAIESYDRKYALHFQGDGNLVLYNKITHVALWSSDTAGKPAGYLALQGDGNLVLYSKSHAPLWNSRTSGKGNSKLVVQNDGNSVLYTPTSFSWATGTSR